MSTVYEVPSTEKFEAPNKKSHKLLSKMALLAAVSTVMSPFEGRIGISGHRAPVSSSFSFIHSEKSQREYAWFGLPSLDNAESTILQAFPCCVRDRKKPSSKTASVRSSVAAARPRPHLEAVTPEMIAHSPVADVIAAGHAGLLAGHVPSSLSDGMGGVYLVRDANGHGVGVFKPGSEEVGMDANPKGHSPRHTVYAARAGVEPGQCMYREVAAAILDDGFAGVPPTCLARLATSESSEPKIGSLQTFVSATGVAGDMGCSVFSVSDVQRIAVLDMRLLNLDRHDGNLLLVPGDKGVGLVPIDHGLCLPARLEVADFEWCWLHWPQVKQPVTPEVKAHIAGLSVDLDITQLAQHGLPLAQPNRRVLAATTRWLQVAVMAGLTLQATALAMVRFTVDTPSRLEKAVTAAKWRAAALAAVNKMSYDQALEVEMESAMQRLVARILGQD